ncbi:MAG TPA: hypothetical protein VN668_09635 [Stellaceae bacterium]|nr:hypothetical protein [Stellaceae bacterium]
MSARSASCEPVEGEPAQPAREVSTAAASAGAASLRVEEENIISNITRDFGFAQEAKVYLR